MDKDLERRLRSRWRFLKPRNPSSDVLRHARIPAEFHGDRLSDIPDAYEYKQALLFYANNAEEFGVKGEGILMVGPHGHGKTSACCALLRVFLIHDVPALFVRWNELGKIFKSWDAASRELQDRILWIRALAIDDVGEQIPGDFEQTLSSFIQVVRHRYDEKLPTFLNTNLEAEEFLARFEAQGSLFRSPRYLFVPVSGHNWREAAGG